MDRYTPSLRLHRFTGTSRRAPPALDRPDRRTCRRRRPLYAHVVKVSQMCDELGMPRGTDVRALCDDLI